MDYVHLRCDPQQHCHVYSDRMSLPCMKSNLLFVIIGLLLAYFDVCDSHLYSDAAPDIMLVSAYFPISHIDVTPVEEYLIKVPEFLNTLSQPLVFFIPHKTWHACRHMYHGVWIEVHDHSDESIREAKELIRTTANKNIVIVVTEYSSIWEIPFAQSNRRVFTDITSTVKDRTFFDKLHHPEQSAIWLSKVSLLEQGIQHYKLWPSTRATFWVDAGVLRREHRRSRALSTWPVLRYLQDDFGPTFEHFGDRCVVVISSYPKSYPRIPKAYKGVHAELLLMGTSDFESVEIFLYYQFFVPGAFFGGSDTAIATLSSAFYNKYSSLLAQGRYVGREEIILTAMALETPHMFAAIDLRQNENFFGQYDFLDRYSLPYERWENYTFNADARVLELELIFGQGIYEILRDVDIPADIISDMSYGELLDILANPSEEIL